MDRCIDRHMDSLTKKSVKQWTGHDMLGQIQAHHCLRNRGPQRHLACPACRLTVRNDHRNLEEKRQLLSYTINLSKPPHHFVHICAWLCMHVHAPRLVVIRIKNILWFTLLSCHKPSFSVFTSVITHWVLPDWNKWLSKWGSIGIPVSKHRSVQLQESSHFVYILLRTQMDNLTCFISGLEDPLEISDQQVPLQGVD